TPTRISLRSRESVPQQRRCPGANPQARVGYPDRRDRRSSLCRNWSCTLAVALVVGHQVVELLDRIVPTLQHRGGPSCGCGKPGRDIHIDTGLLQRPISDHGEEGELVDRLRRRGGGL